MKRFTVSEAEMLLESGRKINQVLNCSTVYLEDFIQYILGTSSAATCIVRLRVMGQYDGDGYVLEIFFPMKTDDGVQIISDIQFTEIP